MRRFLFLCCVFMAALVPMKLQAASDGGVAVTVQEQELAEPNSIYDRQHRWSYAALGDTMELMFHGCSTTDMIQFTDFSNWLIGRDGIASLRELANRCVQISGFKKNRIKRGKRSDGVLYECKVPETNCNNGTCGERGYTQVLMGEKNSECDIFLSTFIKKHNQIATTRNNVTNPGTYVVPTGVNGVYAVVDVILAPGYSRNGGVNQDVNTDPENTKIYVLSGAGVKHVLGLRTWTNDMFINLNSVDGNRGVLNKSYICDGRDVTPIIYKIFNNQRGNPGAYHISQGMQLLPGFAGDTKESLAAVCKFKAQSDIAAHTNGVLFEGKIANLEWLGHYLYGMIREEVAALSDGAMDEVRDLLQWFTNGDNNESKKHQAAADLGQFNQRAVNRRMDRRYADVEFDDPRSGLCYFMHESLNYWTDLSPSEKSSIECINNCNYSSRAPAQDVVICFYRKDEAGIPLYNRSVERLEYEVDDMADGWFTSCENLHLKATDCGIR